MHLANSYMCVTQHSFVYWIIPSFGYNRILSVIIFGRRLSLLPGNTWELSCIGGMLMGNLNGVHDVRNHLDNLVHGSCDNRNVYSSYHNPLMVQKVVFMHQKRPLINFGQFHGLFWSVTINQSFRLPITLFVCLCYHISVISQFFDCSSSISKVSLRIFIVLFTPFFLTNHAITS